MSPYNSFVCGPKFTKFLLFNVEGAVVDQILFGFAILWTVYGILAIKVEGCQKSRRILDVFFALPNFRGQAFQNVYTFNHHWLAARRLVKFCEDSPTSSEVIGAHTLNLKLNFKFSGLKFFGGTPLPVRMYASRAWPICSACKHFRAQQPLMAEI